MLLVSALFILALARVRTILLVRRPPCTGGCRGVYCRTGRVSCLLLARDIASPRRCPRACEPSARCQEWSEGNTREKGMPEKQVFLTQEGYDRLEHELHELRTVRRPAVSDLPDGSR